MSRLSILKTIEYLEQQKIGEKKINFRLKNWEYQDKDIGDVTYNFIR